MAYHFFIAPSKDSKPTNVSVPSSVSKKIISKEVIAEKIQEKHELITMQADLSQKITIDDSWGSLAIFKKITNINFVGTGTYSVDFSKVNSSNIQVKNNTITLKLPEPEVKYINIDEDKTTCEPTQNGLLRFGELKMTSADHQELRKDVTDKMTEKMKDQDLYNKAIENSKSAVKLLVQSFITKSDASNYSIDIEFTK